MEVKSDFEELVERIEERKKVNIGDIIKLVPKSSEQIKAIYGFVKDTKKLIYLLAVCDFFNREEEVIRVISENIRSVSEENGFGELKDFKKFYYDHKRQYENRCVNGTTNKISILESSLDFSFFKPIGSGTPNYPRSADDDPFVHNGIRALEEN